VHSFWTFLAIAILVTVTPGPGTATIVRVAVRDGRRAAFSAILGNCVGVLFWGTLSAVGVSALILASQLAYDGLRGGGALVLVFLGLRSLLQKRAGTHGRPDGPTRRQAGWRAGALTSLSNPKLAAFFVALFPQFLRPGEPVLPVALAMAGTIIVFDLIWYSTLATLADRARQTFGGQLQQRLERVTGGIMVAFGLRLAAELR